MFFTLSNSHARVRFARPPAGAAPASALWMSPEDASDRGGTVLATPVTRTASKKIAVIDEDRGEKPVSCRSEAKSGERNCKIAPTLPHCAALHAGCGSTCC